MNNKKSISSKNQLELGKYLESDMLALTEDEANGGVTPATPYITVGSVAVTKYISSNTCPTSACTRAC